MTDLLLSPPDTGDDGPVTPLDVVARAQVGQVLDLMINSRLTEEQACQKVGVSVRTFQRRFKQVDELQALRDETAAVMAAGVQKAYRAYLDGISELHRRMSVQPGDQEGGKAMSNRDLTAAVKALHLILAEHAHAAGEAPPAPAEADGEPARVRAQWDGRLVMTGPVTVHIASRGGVPVPQVVDGDSRALARDDEAKLP